MSTFDDLLEHKKRLKVASVVAPVLGIGCWAATISYTRLADLSDPEVWLDTSAWVSMSPFFLVFFLLAYRCLPIAQGRLGTARQGERPRLWRAGNPVLRQRGGAAQSLLVYFGLGFAGCMGLALSADSLTGFALPLMYVSLGLLFAFLSHVTYWVELDIETLRILRHRVLLGMQLSILQPARETVRTVGTARASLGGHYKVYAFCQDGSTIPLSPEHSDLKQARFEAERLSDQLMVPLLENVENHLPDTVSRRLRNLSDSELPVRRDWAATAVPAGLDKHRSLYPPLD